MSKPTSSYIGSSVFIKPASMRSLEENLALPSAEPGKNHRQVDPKDQSYWPRTDGIPFDPHISSQKGPVPPCP